MQKTRQLPITSRSLWPKTPTRTPDSDVREQERPRKWGKKNNLPLAVLDILKCVETV